MTEGNVFLLEELIAAVQAEGWKPTAQNAARIGTLAPEAVLRAVAVRLMRLSDDAAGVARAVAVLGDDAELRHVVALTGRAPERVAAAVDALAASDILRPVDAGALRFAHALLASAVYADIATAERATLHRRVAEILHGEQIAPERVAAHLLPSPGSGEGWVVDVLCEVARRARAAGAPESAASYLRRALREPPAAGVRAVRAARAGRRRGRDRPAGRDRASRGGGRGAARRDGERAQTLLELGRALAAAGRHGEALERFDAAAACAAADPAVARRRRGPRRARWGCSTRSGARRCSTRRQARRRGADVGEPGRRPPRALHASRARGRAARGGPRAGPRGGAGATMRRAGAARPCSSRRASRCRPATSWLWSERETTAALDRARAAGSTVAFATASLARAGTRWAQGRLAEALADAEQALDAQRHGWRHLLPCAYGTVVGAARRSRRPRRGRAPSRSASTFAAAVDAGSAMLAPWHAALGRLALAERREEDALAHFEAWRDVVTAIENPACGAGWRAASVPALVSLGRAEEARALAAEELAAARAFGAARAISVALRAAAHAEPHGASEAQVALLEEAVGLMAGSEARLELCRAQLDLGAALRRARRRTDAGRVLGDALELARACGARLVEERVLEELEVAGARMQRAARRGADALSPSERRVVALAVEGLSNRQIADALFVTRKAVEWHLGNAYRKLDVRSRHELPGALND